jgi:ribonuclease HI
LKRVKIFTDGACLGNPGVGGWAAILRYKDKVKEISGGFRLTTNNRMEIYAAIQGLRALKKSERCAVELFTDSRLLVDSFNKGWVIKWSQNNWMRNRKEKALNADLWEELLTECSKHDVKFQWLKGHAGIPENERCDELARNAAMQDELLIDVEYEKINGLKPDVNSSDDE